MRVMAAPGSTATHPFRTGATGRVFRDRYYRRRGFAHRSGRNEHLAELSVRQIEMAEVFEEHADVGLELRIEIPAARNRGEPGDACPSSRLVARSGPRSGFGIAVPNVVLYSSRFGKRNRKSQIASVVALAPAGRRVHHRGWSKSICSTSVQGT